MKESPGKEMSFIDHLEELRWHIIRSGLSIFVFFIIAFVSKEFVFHQVILSPARNDFWTYKMLCKMGEALCIDSMNFQLQNRTMAGQFTMHITISFFIGLILSFPYTFWEIWSFIKPGLYDKERKMTTGIIFFVSVLFGSGILFGYYIVAPLSINFLATYTLDPSIQNYFDLTSYVSLLSMVVLGTGLMFQMPVIVFVLSKIGVVTPEFLRTYRKHALVIILIVAAIITPPDVISQLLVTMPLAILYEVSIFVSATVARKRKRELLYSDELI